MDVWKALHCNATPLPYHPHTTTTPLNTTPTPPPPHTTHTTPTHPAPNKYGLINKSNHLFHLKCSNQTLVWFYIWCFVWCCSVSHWVPISWICLFVCVVGWYPLTTDKQSACCGHWCDFFWLKWVLTQRNIISEWLRMVWKFKKQQQQQHFIVTAIYLLDSLLQEVCIKRIIRKRNFSGNMIERLR